MARLLRRDPEVERLITAFHADLLATGQYTESEVISPARAFLRIGGSEGFERMTFEEQYEISTRPTDRAAPGSGSLVVSQGREERFPLRRVEPEGCTPSGCRRAVGQAGTPAARCSAGASR